MSKTKTIVYLILFWAISILVSITHVIYYSNSQSDLYLIFERLDEVTEYPFMFRKIFSGIKYIVPFDNLFIIIFVTISILLNLGFLLSLLLIGSDKGSKIDKNTIFSALFWIGFTLSATALSFTKIDTLGSILLGLAGLIVFSYPYISSFILSIVGSIKIFPFSLGAAIVGKYDDKKSWIRIAVFALTGIGIFITSILIEGWDKTIAPFSYQGDRGIQVESVLAAPFILSKVFTSNEYNVFFSETSKSWEITGYGTDFALNLSPILSVAFLSLALLCAILPFVKGNWEPMHFVRSSIFILTLFFVCNKVLSPQYILWLGGIVAVYIKKADNKKDIETSYKVAGLTVFIMLLTSLIFPFYYDGVIEYTEENYYNNVIMSIILVVRNVLLVVLTAVIGKVVFFREKEVVGKRKLEEVE